MSDPIADAAAALRDGRLVVLPTDTVYGIAARPDDPAATERLFAAKRRPRALELPILVAGIAEARRVAVLDGRAERLALRWWPGALTLVLPRTPESAGYALGGDAETVGVRVPDERLALALLARTGPLAVTSANHSGSPTPADCEGIVAVFGEEVDVYLCADGPLPGRASTVLDLAHGSPRVIREGAIPADEVLASLST